MSTNSASVNPQASHPSTLLSFLGDNTVCLVHPNGDVVVTQPKKQGQNQ